MIGNNILNRLSSFVIAVIMILLSLSFGTSVFAEGEVPVITISTPGDFVALSKNCVYDSYSRGMQVTLLNDIDMNDVDYEPMKIFCGTFEGGGHHISNLKMDFDGSNKGMCFELGEGGEIRNLNVTGTVKAKKTSEAATSINEIIGNVAKNAGIDSETLTKSTSISILGGIVGANSGRVINCSFDGSIEGDTTIGGIVGENEESGYIESCYNVASVIGNQNVGGIVGKNFGWVKSSKNSGGINNTPIEDSHNIGGIAGLSDGVLEANVNDVSVGYKNVGTNIGGIVGKQTGCVLECQNSGEVLGSKSVGGVFGRFEPYASITLDDVEEFRQNVKSDVDDARENVKSDITDMQDRLNTDVNDILDRFGFLKNGNGGLLGALLGLGDTRGTLSDVINNLGNSQVEVLNAIRDRINNGDSNISNVTDLIDSLSDSSKSIRENLGTLTDSGSALLDSLNGDTRTSLNETLNSINNTIDTVSEVNGTINTLMGDTNDLINDINNSYNDGDWQTLGDRLDSLSGRLDYVQDTMLKPMSDSVTSSLNSLSRTLAALRSDSSSVASAIEKPLIEMQTILKNAKAEIDKINSDIESARKVINNMIEKIKDFVDGLKTTATPKTIGKTFSDIFFITAYADENENLNEDDIKQTLKNLTSVDITTSRDVAGMETDNALVMYCYNSGNVSGGNDIGGIGGTIGIESGVKYGKNVTLPSGQVLSTTSIVKAVVNGCVSQCKVDAKNGYAGGIVGDAALGTIKNSLTETKVSAGDSGYAGGIAGYAKGSIDKSIAMSDLSGKDHVGGIVGEGDSISACYAMPRIDGAPEKSGAITGTADGVVVNNYFIKEGLSGINGADFDGKAVALDYTQMIGDGVLPESMSGFTDGDWYMGSGDIFLPQNRVLSDNTAGSIGALLKAKSAQLANFHFNVSFIVDDKNVKEYEVDYNTILDPNDVPTLETRDGYCPQWDNEITQPIRRNTVFKAEYIDAVKTIGTSEEPPLLLVEGNFKDNSKVDAWETDSVGNYGNEYKAVASYGFTISPDYKGKIRVHVRDKDENGNYVCVVRNGKTRVLDTTRDGSYLVFELDEPSEFTVLHKASNNWKIVGIILLALGLLILIGLLMKNKLDKAKEDSDRSDNDNSKLAKDDDKAEEKLKNYEDDKNAALERKKAREKQRQEIKEAKQRAKAEIKAAKERAKKSIDK